MRLPIPTIMLIKHLYLVLKSDNCQQFFILDNVREF